MFFFAALRAIFEFKMYFFFRCTVGKLSPRRSRFYRRKRSKHRGSASSKLLKTSDGNKAAVKTFQESTRLADQRGRVGPNGPVQIYYLEQNRRRSRGPSRPSAPTNAAERIGGNKTNAETAADSFSRGRESATA